MAFDSLFTGITGLNAYQSWIDMISNNIANTATTGFKGQRMTFADLFYTSQGYASGPSATSGGVNPQQLGLGVKVNSVDTQFAQGGLETTGVNTDLAINGDGFFVMRNANGSSAPVYTRDGAFSLNANGLLYDPASGLAVQGYTADSQGAIAANGVPGSITIPLGIQSQATGTGFGAKVGPNAADSVFDVSMVGNLDQSQYAIENQSPGTGVGKTISTTMYDSLGNPHQATIAFNPVAPLTPPATALPGTLTDANGQPHFVGTRWSYSISFSDGTTMSAGNTGYAFFDRSDQFINTSAGAGGAGGHTVGTGAAAGQGNAVAISAWGPLPPAGSNNAVPTTVGIDFSKMASLAGASTASVLSQNGFGSGTLSNITIGQDGTVQGAFTNGQTRALAQIALATFQNEGGLSRMGGNAFSETVASGLAQLGTGGVGRMGGIVSGSLEQSNVSLADQFTKLIVAQRAFEANTRGITTADQNLQTVINLRASEN